MIASRLAKGLLTARVLYYHRKTVALYKT
jgi:hypothetical protein